MGVAVAVDVAAVAEVAAVAAEDAVAAAVVAEAVGVAAVSEAAACHGAPAVFVESVHFLAHRLEEKGCCRRVDKRPGELLEICCVEGRQSPRRIAWAG